MTTAEQSRCPVCRARLRTTSCARCGADLSPLFALMRDAFEARSRAREALYAGNFGAAALQAAHAQELVVTPEGTDLVELSRWLKTLHKRPEHS